MVPNPTQTTVLQPFNQYDGHTALELASHTIPLPSLQGSVDIFFPGLISPDDNQL